MTLYDSLKAVHGQKVTLLKNTKQSLMSGELKIADIADLSGTEIDAIVVKGNTKDTQTREGRLSSFPSYMLVDSSIALTEDDAIKTSTEIFFIHEVTLRHNNITGTFGNDPKYKRADLELYGYL